MSERFIGKVEIQRSDSDSNVTIALSGESANLDLGGSGQDGDLIVRGASGTTKIHLLGRDAYVRVGGDNDAGTISVRDDSPGAGKETIQINGGTGDISLGGNGQDGDLNVRGASGTTKIHLLGRDALVRVGGDRDAGTISVRDDSPGAGKETIQINGGTGDIILRNADCAEEFDVAVAEAVEPGSVMVIDEGGGIKQSTEAYDKRVTGVVSGAGDLKPGLVLDKKDEATNRIPLALMGKVYCKVDAQYALVEVGDLLTTSPTPGHAMKATDPTKAFGTIIGKALRPLETGKGLIPILVTLQ